MRTTYISRIPHPGSARNSFAGLSNCVRYEPPVLHDVTPSPQYENYPFQVVRHPYICFDRVSSPSLICCKYECGRHWYIRGKNTDVTIKRLAVLSSITDEPRAETASNIFVFFSFLTDAITQRKHVNSIALPAEWQQRSEIFS